MDSTDRTSVHSGASLHVVLVHPEIPWNVGNAGRTCLAAGAQLHLVRPLGFSLTDPEVRRAGLDYWPRVAPVIWPDWDALAQSLPALGEPLLFTSEGERDLFDVAVPRRCALIFGRESVGLPDTVRRAFAGRLVRIPMADAGVRSLNLSSAVAVALYEALRQHRSQR